MSELLMSLDLMGLVSDRDPLYSGLATTVYLL